MSDVLFMRQRNKVLGLYQKAGQDFVASTRPYHSVQSLSADIVDIDTTNGVAWAVFRANQSMYFFSYGVGDRINLANVVNLQATEAETNLANGKSTNGASDYVIEGVGMHCRAMMVEYDTTSGGNMLVVGPTDADVVQCMAGNLPIIDPAAIIMPPQGQSPANMEQALYHAIQPFLSLEFEWDRRRTEKLGVCDLLPQAGANSYLRTNGEPRSDNRYRIPEGYVWRRDGEPDGEFQAICRLERAVCCPISLRTHVDNPASFEAPDQLHLEITMRLFGLNVELPSAN